MVLDNASSSETDGSFSESAPNSDADPYSEYNPNAPYRAFTIDKTQLQKPIPIIGPLIGYNDIFFLKVFDSKIKLAERTLNRPPTQEEANALAFWTSKQIAVYSYGAPLGIAAGLWRCANTATTFRFPFYQPDMVAFNPSSGFPGASMPLVKGMKAVYMFHLTRALGYGIFGSWVSKILFGGYSMSVATVGELSDKRLKAFQEAIRANAQQRRGSLPGDARSPGSIQRQPNTTRRPSSPVDDASPTGGAFGQEDDTGAFNDVGFENGIKNSDVGDMSKGNTRMQGQSQQWPQGPGMTRPRPVPAPVPARTQEPQDRAFDMFDDASPTSGQGVAAETAAPQGSAWERLRRGEKPLNTPQDPSTRPRPNQNSWSRQQNESQREAKGGGESFSFSKAEEERSFAKERAQKSFEAGNERENEERR